MVFPYNHIYFPNMDKLLNSTKQISLFFTYFILGGVFLSGFLTLIVFSLPIFLYRWIICQILGPLCRGDRGKAVTLTGAGMAFELNKDSLRDRPRFLIVVSTFYEGAVTVQELKERTQRCWIDARESHGGRLKYPEFQQSVVSWMGHPFWEQDKSFSLDNHLTHSKCEDSWTEIECEQYGCSIVEGLLNKPFPKGRSPWEVHMISNFRDSNILSGGREMTILVLRVHHCMADGFAVFSAFCGTFFDVPFSECGIAPKQSAPKLTTAKGGLITNYLRKISHFWSFPFKLIRDIGSIGSLTLLPTRTPWFILERKRTNKQLYARSKMLPISKLKFVKDTFGVSFTATVLSSIGAGTAYAFKSKGLPNQIKELPFASPLPLEGHPLKLRNHWTTSHYVIPIDQTLRSLERLKKAEKQFQNARQSTIPALFPFAVKLVGSHLPFISKILMTNRSFSTAMSNFAGPRKTIRGFGKDVIIQDFGTGLAFGVAGLVFMIHSYGNNIRISAVAENAAMEKYEMEELLKAISDEIDKLYELAETHKFSEISII